MKRSKPLGMIFDLGDTIIHNVSLDWIPFNVRLLGSAPDDRGYTPESFQAVADSLNRELEKVKNEAMIEHDITGFFRMLFETTGIEPSISCEEAGRICWHSAFRFVPQEGIPELLDTLEKHEIKAGILSNCTFTGTIIGEELAKHGLDGKFSFIVSSADYGIRKPHPMLFDIAVRKIGLEPEDIWYAGDKPQYDVIGASRAGLFPVWYNPGNVRFDHGCDCLEIRRWQELTDIIETL